VVSELLVEKLTFGPKLNRSVAAQNPPKFAV
jgi:hypothetical protein